MHEKIAKYALKILNIQKYYSEFQKLNTSVITKKKKYYWLAF